MLPRLEIRHLAVLVSLSQTGSMTSTAARLGLTQSAVSHRLREAERRLGMVLVERRANGMILTAEGERLRVLGERVLRDLAQLEQDIESDQHSTQTLVRLGQATYSRYHWLPAFISYVNQIEPDLRVDLSGSAALRPFAALNDGSVDVVTLYGREIAPGRYRWRKLATDPLVAVVAPQHRLAEQAYLDAEAIAGERYFAYPLTAEPGYEWEALIGAPSVPFRRITQMPTADSVIDLVRAGFGVGVFSRWAVEPEIANGTLVAKPISAEGVALDWWAVTRVQEPEDSAASRLAKAFVSWSKQRDAGLATLGFHAPD